MSGIKRGKFQVTHYARGPLGDEDVFVLVPGRDPAAVSALRAYARRTDDVMLASQVDSWADRIEGPAADETRVIENALGSLPVWVSILAREVRDGTMGIETALQRIAGHAANAMLDREADEENL